MTRNKISERFKERKPLVNRFGAWDTNKLNYTHGLCLILMWNTFWNPSKYYLRTNTLHCPKKAKDTYVQTHTQSSPWDVWPFKTYSPKDGNIVQKDLNRGKMRNRVRWGYKEKGREWAKRFSLKEYQMRNGKTGGRSSGGQRRCIMMRCAQPCSLQTLVILQRFSHPFNDPDEQDRKECRRTAWRLYVYVWRSLSFLYLATGSPEEMTGIMLRRS